MEYYCNQNKEWQGPVTPTEEKEEGSEDSAKDAENMTVGNKLWKNNGYWKERWVGK